MSIKQDYSFKSLNHFTLLFSVISLLIINLKSSVVYSTFQADMEIRFNTGVQLLSENCKTLTEDIKSGKFKEDIKQWLKLKKQSKIIQNYLSTCETILPLWSEEGVSEVCCNIKRNALNFLLTIECVVKAMLEARSSNFPVFLLRG